jgi:tetratricopeptide (TPR) repeat protein
VYYRRGAYQRAEELFQRALQIREEALGTNHPDVAQTRASLAYLFTTLGKFNEAEQYYKVATSFHARCVPWLGLLTRSPARAHAHRTRCLSWSPASEATIPKWPRATTLSPGSVRVPPPGGGGGGMRA